MALTIIELHMAAPKTHYKGGHKMIIEVKKLTSDLAEDYVHFFDV